MIPAGVAHVAAIFLGAVLPAYDSFKAIDSDDAQRQLVLLVYWITFALFTAAEALADAALFWLPLYGEMKLVLLLWLLAPQYRGGALLYRALLHDWLRRHQPRIDHYLQLARDHGHLWMVATLAKVLLSAMFTVGRAVWLVAPHQPAAAAVAGQSRSAEPPSRRLSELPLAPPRCRSASTDGTVAPSTDAPPPPLDTRQVAALGAGLEESCRMLLRSALAAQAGNQLLATLHEQSSGVTLAAPTVAPRRGQPPPEGATSAGESRSVEKALHRRRGEQAAARRKSRSTSSLLNRATARSQQTSRSKKLLWRDKMDYIQQMVGLVEERPPGAGTGRDAHTLK